MLSTMRVASRSATRNFVPRVCSAARVAHRFNSAAATSSAAAAKLQKGLATELQFEKENYAKPEVLSKLPGDWTLTDTPGDVNMKIEKKLSGDRVCRIEWQLVSPFDPDMEEFEGQQDQQPPAEPMEEVDFTITIENKDATNGMTYFCNTQQSGAAEAGAASAPEAGGHRFIVGNVKVWTSVAERDNPAAFNGPDFEDLEDSLQEAMDEYLGEIGISDSVFDFIDASAIDKEHTEYMRWLENLNAFMKA